MHVRAEKVHVRTTDPWFADMKSALPASHREEVPWVAGQTGWMAMQERECYHNGE